MVGDDGNPTLRPEHSGGSIVGAVLPGSPDATSIKDTFRNQVSGSVRATGSGDSTIANVESRAVPLGIEALPEAARSLSGFPTCCDVKSSNISACQRPWSTITKVESDSTCAGN